MTITPVNGTIIVQQGNREFNKLYEKVFPDTKQGMSDAYTWADDKAMESLKQADSAVKLAHEKFSALAAENAGLKHAMAVTLEHVSVTDAVQAGVAAMIINDALHHSKTPVTDAFLAEVRAKAHKEGAYFVANRMLAAWDAGFIDDTAKNAADIARMILTSTEFMADAPEGDFDRSFADGVLEGIAAQLRKGVQS